VLLPAEIRIVASHGDVLVENSIKRRVGEPGTMTSLDHRAAPIVGDFRRHETHL
jgi:hypothetical protein